MTYHEFNGYAFTYNTLGSILTAKAAVKKDENGNETSVEIVKYEYSDDVKQDVLNSSFGNNQIIDYEYNTDGEITAIKLDADADPKYEYKYSSEVQTETEGEDILTANLDGEWVKITDTVSNLFKVIQENKTSVYDSDKALVYSVENVSKDEEVEDSFNGTVTTIGENVYTLVTEENKDTFKTNNNIDFVKNYVYNEDKDELESTSIDGVFTTNYGYGDDSSITVFENVLNIKEDGTLLDGYIFNYGYENENISSESLTVMSKAENGSSVENNESVSYEYDDNDQLVKATSSTTEWTYEYDSRGNIITKSIRNVAADNTVTYNYTYDSVWQDRLVSYNGETISYTNDEGFTDPSNPLIYRGNELTWTMGRQLASFGDNSYTYNEDGIRTSKTSNGVTTKFLLDGYNVIEQTDGTTTLHFFYDSNGEVIGFRYNENDYFYVKNAMSDIIAITDSNKNIVAEYRYDPWGDILSISGDTVIGELNPFRYRSYYYDNDIQMYYLQSRYYDAEVGRFINCDDVSYIGVDDTVNSYNAFAYCENNPIYWIDPYGFYKIKSFSQQTWLTRMVGQMYGGNIGGRKTVYTLKNKNVKLAIDLILEKVVYPDAAFRHSVVFGKDGADIDISIGGLSFDLVGGSASYTYSKKVGITSVGIIYKIAEDAVGFGTSFGQSLPYNKERMTMSITLRTMLEITEKYITKSLVKVIIRTVINVLLPYVRAQWNVLYKLYKGTSNARALAPAMVKALNKAY